MEHYESAVSIQDVTIVCRCEEVAAGAIRQAIHEGSLTLNDVKRRTRAGMGLCQGIFCMRTIAQMIHTEAGEPREAVAPMTARPPARVLPLTALADLEE